MAVSEADDEEVVIVEVDIITEKMKSRNAIIRKVQSLNITMNTGVREKETKRCSRV